MTDIARPAPLGLPLLWAVLILTGIGWGATQLFSKIVTNAGHHPLGIAVTATVVGAAILTAALAVMRKPLPLGRRYLVFYAVCGLLGTALPNTVGYAGMTRLPVGIMSIVISTVPMMTFLMALAFRMDRPDPMRIAGLGCGTAAVLLLVVPEASLPEPGQALWVLLPVITALSYSAENIYLAIARPEECGPLETMCGLLWAALFMLVPLTAATGTWMPLWPLGTAEWALIAMTALHVASYGAFVWLVGRAGPVFAAQVAYVVTLSGVFWGMAILGERHSAWVWLALGLMLAGLTLVKPRR